MRSLPETRSRRLTSDSKHRLQNLKRLKNGFAVHHVTTRSQAKISKSPKVLRKKLRSQTKIGKSIAHANSSKKNDSCTNTNGIVRVSRAGNCFHSVMGRKEELRRESNSCQGGKKVVLTNGHHNQGPEMLHKSHHSCCFHGSLMKGSDMNREHLAAQRAEAAEKRADRLKKRRSALWVLNCEAESFLFGETAAEDHEVELPPMSTPPNKRRRVRTNELGNLLKESPILGSKLRSPSLSSRSSPSKDGDGKGESTRKVGTDSSENCRRGSSSESESVLTDISPPKLEAMAPSEDNELAQAASSPFPVHINNISIDGLPWLTNSNSDSVRFNNILSTMEWKFSFEELPSDETWYSTFKRQEKSRNSLPGYYYPKEEKTFASVLLPYETKVLTSRSPAKKRFSRLPRKSPRCHASTLAILSSLKHRGHRHRSDTLVSPGLIIPQINNASTTRPPGLNSPPCPEGDSKNKRVRKRVPSSSSPSRNHLTLSTSTRTSTLPPVSSPPQLTIPIPSASPVSPASPPHRIRDLSATQYLWDSIQLLSDPYVIQILAGDRSKSPGPNHNNLFSSTPDVDANKCNSKSRKNSGGSPTLNISQQHPNSFLGPATNFTLDSATLSAKCNVNFNNGNIALIQHPDKLHLETTPVSSNANKPNFRNKSSSVFSTTLNCDNKKLRLSVNGKNLTVNGAEGTEFPNGINNSRYRKGSNSNKKSPVVLVADIFKNNSRGGGRTTAKAPTVTTTVGKSNLTPKLNNNFTTASGTNNNLKSGSREELLFLVDGLPPLPAWPV
ncbi:unnamed protein product [Allacma fusca]|uniref:Uncharacterized protein n=1 Tax=Allacma fusca TaxID=39272 RepID=A0A8J2L1Z4_9HEXA|nr:unnamed protein product [Allacma fusca]